MIIKIAEYTVKEGEVGVALKAIDDFVVAIRVHEPETFYEAFRKGETLSFVHVMKFKDEAAESKHAKAPYTAAFAATLYPRCEKEPVFTDLLEIT